MLRGLYLGLPNFGELEGPAEISPSAAAVDNCLNSETSVNILTRIAADRGSRLSIEVARCDLAQAAGWQSRVLRMICGWHSCIDIYASSKKLVFRVLSRGDDNLLLHFWPARETLVYHRMSLTQIEIFRFIRIHFVFCDK